MTNEYSIACLLDSISHKQLKKNFAFLDEYNHPHISLFQFKMDENHLHFWKKHVESVDISSSYETSGVSLVETNVFLDVIDHDSSLQTASDYLADIYFTQCKNKEILSQINMSQLIDKQLSLVKKYGIYWVKDNFSPHVTLRYSKTDISLNDLTIPTTLTILSPKIYRIDGVGRIIDCDNC